MVASTCISSPQLKLPSNTLVDLLPVDPAGSSFNSTNSTIFSNYSSNGWRVETAAAFNVPCCVCNEVCFNCSAAGSSNCYTCANGYVSATDSASSERCIAADVQTADESQDTVWLIGMSIAFSFLLFTTLTTTTLLYVSASLLSYFIVR